MHKAYLKKCILPAWGGQVINSFILKMVV